jgi:hypothetical protein
MMQIDPVPVPTRTPVTGRAVLRVVGALLALTTVLTAAMLVVQSAPAQAGGSSWAGTGAVLPPNADTPNASELLSTSCPAPGNCVAVGAYASGGIPVGLIDTQSGGSWTALEAPLPPDANADPSALLIDTSCPSVGSCIAVGFYNDAGGHRQGLVLTETGGSWAATTAPLPPGANASPAVDLLSAACAAPGTCIATGEYVDSGGEGQGLLLSLSGGAWRATEAPLPGNAGGNPAPELVSTSCSSSGSCAAVGLYNDNAALEAGLVLTLDGGAWTATPAPLPPGVTPTGSALLESVSCPATGRCTAVGYYRNASAQIHSMVESIVDGKVTATPVALPPDARTSGTTPDPTDALLGVSCPSTSYCVAVGTYATQAASGLAPLIETFTGGAWAASRGPGSLDPSSQSVLFGVSCSWPGSCASAGISQTTSSTSTAIVETLTTGVWTGTTAILPPDAPVPNMVELGEDGFLGHPVSCSAGSCVLTGYWATMSTAGGFINTFPNLAGYQLAAADGGLFAFNAPFFGSMGGRPLNQSVVGMAVVPDSGGYYEAASDGGIFAFNAPFFGSMGGRALNKPIVGIAFDSLTGGYYEVASDGGIFAFNAPFFGSMGGRALNKPIVGIAFDAMTGGYYEVASDGGLFAFNAPFQGSTGNLTLDKPIVGMAYDYGTGGYYEVASDGGLFAFNTPFLGSMGGQPLNKPIVGMAYDYVTGGYYEVASDGGLFAFSAPFQGSTGALILNKPVVGMAFG